MTTREKRFDKVITLLPILGIALFVLFYIIAALFYPEGSYASPNQSGFSLKNNYLCDLLDNRAINGVFNSARTYARIALGILCFSLILFWYQLSKLFDRKNRSQTIMSIAGMLSMLITLFLASGIHDFIIRIAGVFGVIALLISFIELYKANYYKLLLIGIICLLLFLTNYYIYETELLIDILPLIQKVTFLSFISWFILLSVHIYRKLR
ncbi:hypothetical protein [Algibacter luteus]|uniref:DUF998 domain-containing protein n=1 Tax=Algibacter luteus TaxID=1178825 RepID=A0A1M6GTQ4_9FLAO|nr:hypothetical protein [Algibacter luteus]SHJ13297.1 hypothetical protein SAMN05216261_2908 [Algibacter luteus]